MTGALLSPPSIRVPSTLRQSSMGCAIDAPSRPAAISSCSEEFRLDCEPCVVVKALQHSVAGAVQCKTQASCCGVLLQSRAHELQCIST